MKSARRARIPGLASSLLLAFACALPSSSVPPPRAPANEYRARFTNLPVLLDGRLDDEAWSAAPWTADFVDIEGPDRLTPRFRTRARMLWDERFLYVAAELEEPDVWATLRRHDEIVFHDDDFEIFLDPDGDGAAYYEIETNALATIFDLFLARTYRAGGPAVHSWDCKGLVTRIAVSGTMNDPRDVDRGWTLEWAIPWAALAPPDRDDAGRPLPLDDSLRAERARAGATPKVGDSWRINFSRVEWRHRPQERPGGEKEDNWVWSPQWIVDMHLPDRWGRVTFVRE